MLIIIGSFIEALFIFLPTVAPTIIAILCLFCILAVMLYFLGIDITIVCLLLFGIALVYYGWWLPLRQKRNLDKLDK